MFARKLVRQEYGAFLIKSANAACGLADLQLDRTAIYVEH